jgi:hypothetical protein
LLFLVFCVLVSLFFVCLVLNIVIVCFVDLGFKCCTPLMLGYPIASWGAFGTDNRANDEGCFLPLLPGSTVSVSQESRVRVRRGGAVKR